MAETHFGNFLRHRYDRFGGIAGVSRRSKAGEGKGISESALVLYVKEAEPPETMQNLTRIILAEALGFKTWADLDIAWRSTPLPPYKGKDAPIFARGLLTQRHLALLSEVATVEDFERLVSEIRVDLSGPAGGVSRLGDLGKTLLEAPKRPPRGTLIKSSDPPLVKRQPDGS